MGAPSKEIMKEIQVFGLEKLNAGVKSLLVRINVHRAIRLVLWMAVGSHREEHFGSAQIPSYNQRRPTLEADP